MTLPLGYRYATLYAGIRKVAKDDLCLIVSDSPAFANLLLQPSLFGLHAVVAHRAV
ncbi:MAG: hypothetical protein NTV52_30635 [Acidobacteria bacterium]|nr:hypothetical protein [Acidobacteriota bacterium]